MAHSESQDMSLLMRDYRLTTAEIYYHFPDYPRLLQTYIWQALDLAPKFPTLKKFLGFWERELDGKIHSVKVSHNELITPGEFRFAQGNLTIQ